MLNIIRRVLALSGDLASRIRWSFVFSFIDGLFEMVPLGCLFFVLHALGNNTFSGETVIGCVIVLGLGLIGRFIFKYLLYRFQSTAGFEFTARERIVTGDHLCRLPMGFFTKHGTGEITSIMTSDLNFLELYSMHIMDRVVTGTTSIVVTGLFMLVFDWRIGTIFIVGTACALAVYNIMQKKSIALAERHRTAQADAVAATIEYVQGIETVKAYNMASETLHGVRRAFEQSNGASYAIDRTFAPLNAAYDICFKIAAAIMMGFAAWLGMAGAMNMATFAVVLVASFLVFNPIQVMGQITPLIRITDKALDRVEAIQNEPQIDHDGREVSLDAHSIDVADIVFSYDGVTRAIDNVSAFIPEAYTLAVVGPSGSGKTTFAHLIARFYDVDEGAIAAGGHPIKEMTCDSLLSNITMVFQGVYLFSDTVRANIAFGRPDASIEEIEAAAKAACCHDFISALPNGYDSIIGEAGNTLSGGEKQRIAVARAILKDAPIVILDEATASIDPENERDIQRALSAVAQEKTVIIIAHRLSTIRDADRIIVLDQGRVSQYGTHESLMVEQGIYQNFWNTLDRSRTWRISRE